VTFKTPTKNIFLLILYKLLFGGTLTFTLFFEDKGRKKSQNSRNLTTFA
jgi:hypothetical protein